MLRDPRERPSELPISSVNSDPVDGRTCELLDCYSSFVAFKGREEITSADSAQLPAETGAGAAAYDWVEHAERRRCRGDDFAILRRDRLNHPRGQLPFLRRRPRSSDPGPGLSSSSHDVVGQPVKMLPRPSIGRQSDDSIDDLDRADAPKLAPQIDAGTGRFTGKLVSEEDPIAAAWHDSLT
jgi:hypothetical protein